MQRPVPVPAASQGEVRRAASPNCDKESGQVPAGRRNQETASNKSVSCRVFSHVMRLDPNRNGLGVIVTKSLPRYQIFALFQLVT